MGRTTYKPGHGAVCGVSAAGGIGGQWVRRVQFSGKRGLFLEAAVCLGGGMGAAGSLLLHLVATQVISELGGRNGGIFPDGGDGIVHPMKKSGANEEISGANEEISAMVE